MSAVIPTIELILEALGTVSSLGLLGSKATQLSPIFDTLSAVAKLPDQFATERQALLDQVNLWLSENREPTDAELDAFKDVRDSIDAQVRALRAS